VVAQARALKAVHEDAERGPKLTVGRAVADQLVGERIADALKQQRKLQRERQQAEAARTARVGGDARGRAMPSMRVRSTSAPLPCPTLIAPSKSTAAPSPAPW
jgi:hypothetical protein